LLPFVALRAGAQESTAPSPPPDDGKHAAAAAPAEPPPTYGETLTVSSVSRRAERILDAPAAVSTLGADEVQLAGSAGQIPRLVAFAPGVTMTQSGLYDFNFNVRGLNQTHNRRVQTLIDGRSPAIPFLGSQEWEPLSFLADDVERIELVRGPSSALYGRNSFNGVLNVVTKAPRGSEGGQLRLTAGELSTLRGDLRWAGQLGARAWAKVLAGHSQSKSFTRSRNVTTEYAGLALEPVPLADDQIEMDSLLARLDLEPTDAYRATFEGAVSEGGGETRLSSPGRTELLHLRRRWARASFGAPHWNAFGAYNQRLADDQLFLGSGAKLFLDEHNAQLELQGHQDFAGGRLRLVGGGAWSDERVDSAPPHGSQTLLPAAVHTENRSAYAQLDWDATARLKLVAAARWDDGTQHDPRVSPKAALVFALAANHTLRLTYNEAFQTGNYGELYIGIPAAPPVDLSAVEQALAPLLGGVPLHLQSIPINLYGNPDLAVETIRTVELGYSGVIGQHAFLTVDVFRNQMRDFITDTLPAVNPAYPRYQAPAGLSPAAAAIVEATLLGILPGLTNGPDGAPQYVLSFGNAGRVDSQGAELGLTWTAGAWELRGAYTWLDFDIKEDAPGPGLSPNAAENTLTAGLTYRSGPLAATLNARWVDGYRWVSGVYAGEVPSYEVADLAARYALNRHWTLGLDVANLLDNEHYELVGGDLLRRRAVGYVAYGW
jgi:iron complex outermembrane receptor protein